MAAGFAIHGFVGGFFSSFPPSLHIKDIMENFQSRKSKLWGLPWNMFCSVKIDNRLCSFLKNECFENTHFTQVGKREGLNEHLVSGTFEKGLQPVLK